MLIELGHAALILAMLVAGFGMALPLLSRLSRTPLLAITPAVASVQFLLVSAALFALAYAYATSDFSVVNVVLNSHSDKPLIFKISGTWGNHEGSMLLWIWVLALYGFAVALLRPDQHDLQQRALVIQSAIAAGFIAFVLFTSNPFIRVFPPAPEGDDLNPLLQDIGLALHPPMLYIGYVGYSIVFAFAVAGLWQGRIDAMWARAVQPLILAAWTALTLGIALGSWWAYRELGWGGWWFWDPVENVSLLPWLVGTALLHSNMVLMKRGMFARWVALLAILSFAMSLIGTFIVRSGLVMSVHAFTTDPLRGYAILLYIVLAVGAALVFYARSRFTRQVSMHFVSREGAILVNNLLLLTLAFTILLSILVPLVLTMLDKPSITVGAPYFNSIFFPLAAPIILLAGVSPLIPWGALPAMRLRRVLKPLMMFAAAGALFTFIFISHSATLAMLTGAFTAWLLSATLIAAAARFHALPVIAGQGFIKRLMRFPMGHLATLCAHLGLAVLCGAIGLSSLFKTHYEAALPESGILQFDRFRLELVESVQSKQHTYTSRRATFDVFEGDTKIARLTPEIRNYSVRNMETNESSVHGTVLRDVYLVIGSMEAEKTRPQPISVRLYVSPGMFMLWLGFGLMALGGGIGTIAHLRRGVV